MNHKDMEKKIKTAMNHTFPDDPERLNRILLKCEQQKGDAVMEHIKTQRGKPRIIRIASTAAAVIVVLIAVLGAFMYQSNWKPDSSIILDVNPSIELVLSAKEKVLSVTAKNEDAKQILDGMNLKGADLNVAVNALLGSLVKHGYIDELANSILVTVENDDAKRSSRLQQELVSEIDRILSSQSIDGAILSQNFTTQQEDKALQKLSEQYGISLGKASLIRTLSQNNPQFNEKNLAGLTINELNLLLKSQGKPTTSGIQSVGSASDKAYIGIEKAKSIALSHAGVTKKDAVFSEATLDMDDAVVEYDVEFSAGSVQYEYSIDARTGGVLSYESEKQPSKPDSAGSGNQSSGTIPLNQAKQTALSHAGVVASKVTYQKAGLDTEDGKKVYEIEFYTSEKEYDYVIDASSGRIVSYDQESRKAAKPTAGSGSASAGGITEAQAKQIAQKKAPGASITSFQLDTENGQAVYEIELREGKVEYECKILKSTGKIIQWEKELED